MLRYLFFMGVLIQDAFGRLSVAGMSLCSLNCSYTCKYDFNPAVSDSIVPFRLLQLE